MLDCLERRESLSKEKRGEKEEEREKEGVKRLEGRVRGFPEYS